MGCERESGVSIILSFYSSLCHRRVYWSLDCFEATLRQLSQAGNKEEKGQHLPLFLSFKYFFFLLLFHTPSSSPPSQFAFSVTFHFSLDLWKRQKDCTKTELNTLLSHLTLSFLFLLLLLLNSKQREGSFKGKSRIKFSEILIRFYQVFSRMAGFMIQEQK